MKHQNGCVAIFGIILRFVKPAIMKCLLLTLIYKLIDCNNCDYNNCNADYNENQIENNLKSDII